MAERACDHEIEASDHQEYLERDHHSRTTAGEQHPARNNGKGTDQNSTGPLDGGDVHYRPPMRPTRRPVRIFGHAI
jgi:hypothetical protein